MSTQDTQLIPPGAAQGTGLVIQLSAGGASWITEENGNNPFTPQPKLHYDHFGIDAQTQLRQEGNIFNGGVTNFYLPHSGDVMLNLRLKIRVKSDVIIESWAAENTIDHIKIFVGDVLIDKYSSEYQRLYYNMVMDSSKKNTWDKMTSAIGVSGSNMYLPLIFGFCQHQDQCIPIAGLKEANVRVEVKWSSRVHEIADVSNITMWSDVAYLSGKDKTRVQYTNENILINTIKEGTHPIGGPGEYEITLFTSGVIKDLWWTYVVDPVVNKPEPNLGNSTQPHQSTGIARISIPISQGYISKSQLFLNQDVKVCDYFDEKYYNLVRPYMYYTGCSAPGYNAYNWALRPVDTQPTGHLNVNMLENMSLKFTATTTFGTLYWCSSNISILRKENGMLRFIR